jgi:8-oxo-dGTP diphosphatase
VIDAATGWYAVPTTIEAVVVAPDGRVLVLRNLRGEWELPGGWPSEGDRDLAEVLRREILEEAAIEIEPGPLVHAERVLVAGEQRVAVAYRCDGSATDAARTSDEHGELRWIDAYATAIRLALAT